ncbi:MAG: fibrillarin-like rRNA/tRNA 2'-O-methyltransferase [Thermoprotei archaeon]|jgi:fibrillarin-like pre-rRNA processing protein
MPGIYFLSIDEGGRIRRELATKNLVRGYSVYGEPLVRVDNEEYRIWIPYRSKLAAFIIKGFRGDFIRPGSSVLYLGAAQGTTVSHVSDVIGNSGIVYAVEISRVAMSELLKVSLKKKNIVPILADARRPEGYMNRVLQVDYLYCDVAQPNQAELFIDNAKYFLKVGGKGMIAIKARSIDVVADPARVFAREREALRKGGFEILDQKQLEPFEKDHLMIYAEWKGNDQSNSGG